MCIKMMYDVTAFKNVFQYQTAKFNNAKPQLLCINLIINWFFGGGWSMLHGLWDLSFLTRD